MRTARRRLLRSQSCPPPPPRPPLPKPCRSPRRSSRSVVSRQLLLLLLLHPLYPHPRPSLLHFATVPVALPVVAVHLPVAVVVTRRRRRRRRYVVLVVHHVSRHVHHIPLLYLHVGGRRNPTRTLRPHLLCGRWCRRWRSLRLLLLVLLFWLLQLSLLS